MKQILIIDDSVTDQFLNRHLFQKVGVPIQLLVASDGQEALELLERPESQPLLILLDINMPGMNGHEFLLEYAKTGRTIPVIVMLTSSDQEDDRKRCTQYKVVRDYFLKPLTEEKVRLIAELLESVQ